MTRKTVFGAEIPFVDHCRIEEVGFTETGTRLRLEIGPEHLNNLGIAHGGILCTLLDVAMGTACRTKMGAPCMTLTMNVSFLSPGKGVLTADGEVVKAGRSVVFASAEIRNADGTIVATATGTLKPVPPRPA